MAGISIGKLARAARVSIDTIRYYERRGLLPPAPRRPSGFRVYSQDDLRLLKFICRARELGFSLADVAELLKLTRDPHGEGVLAIVDDKVAAIDCRLVELGRWREALRAFRQQCLKDSETAPSLQELLKEQDSASALEPSRLHAGAQVRDTNDGL